MHTKRFAAAFALAAFALASCATSSTKLNDVRIGMTKEQIVGLLGAPDSTSAQANIEYLTYYLANDAAGREQPYMVRLVDHHVESFGRFIQLLDVYNRPVAGGSSTGLGAVMPYSMNTDVVTQLQVLKKLQDQGVLTGEEFERVKTRLLADRE